MTEQKTMHDEFRELIAQAQQKLDDYRAERGGDDRPTDLAALEQQLNVTDWYLSAAIHKVADRLDSIQATQARLVGNLDGDD